MPIANSNGVMLKTQLANVGNQLQLNPWNYFDGYGSDSNVYGANYTRKPV